MSLVAVTGTRSFALPPCAVSLVIACSVTLLKIEEPFLDQYYLIDLDDSVEDAGFVDLTSSVWDGRRSIMGLLIDCNGFSSPPRQRRTALTLVSSSEGH